MLKASVSGSFHRHMPAIYAAVNELRAEGVDVLSPSDPRVVDHLGEFLFVASDKLRSVKLVQDRHFEAIKRSDFLWVVCPDGYTGASTSAEIGAAHATGIPVFSTHLPLDATLQHYVRRVPSIRDLLAVMRSLPSRPKMSPHILVDPHHAVETSHAALDRMHEILSGRRPQQTTDRDIASVRATLRGTLGF
jgi:hypothetical protein